MQDTKYYIPTIEEFHIGFEFEYKAVPADVVSNDGYIKSTFDYVWTIPAIKHRLDDYPMIRVKYLDSADIESLGFTDKDFYEISSTSSFYKEGKDNLIYQIEVYWHMCKLRRENLIRVYKGIQHQYPYTELFRGDIKNKSELKKLLTQLGIS